MGKSQNLGEMTMQVEIVVRWAKLCEFYQDVLQCLAISDQTPCQFRNKTTIRKHPTKDTRRSVSFFVGP